MIIISLATIVAFVVGYDIGMRFAHSSHSFASLIVHCVAMIASGFVTAATVYLLDLSLRLEAIVVVMLAICGFGMVVGAAAGSMRNGGR